MRSRIGIGAAVVAALVVLFFVARPDDDEGAAPPPTTAAPTTGMTPTPTAAPRPERVRVRIAVRNGRPVGGIATIDAERGQRVSLRVTADAADHVHVHGYDLFADVAPGRPAVLNFDARLTGRFEIELEDTHRQIAQLRVTE